MKRGIFRRKESFESWKEVRGDEQRGVHASSSSSSAKETRTLDRLNGGEYVRGLDGRRRLDKISGGELLRSADDGALLRSLALPYALRGPSPPAPDARRGLDKIGGGEYIRSAAVLPFGSAAKRQEPHGNALPMLLMSDFSALTCGHAHPRHLRPSEPPSSLNQRRETSGSCGRAGGPRDDKAEEVGDVSASVEDDHAASMDLDSTSSKRRHDGATSVLQEQRLRQPEREWRVAGKKPRVTRAQRSSSLPRDDTEKL
ncbi:hypothetical protein HPB49_024204 [Dermacentor silvarum]|uniref:Uncharacterized protein n=1 Tax=Dermacentor silvarum TaxID=543639 RepID=A0ACB8D967_DERSI|nr:hypothetical protein HPB49_024204 [Dermacentor silvarum]